jgi:catecholate siderophore receptor
MSVPFSRRPLGRSLLPLGAMVAGMALAPESTRAQSAPADKPPAAEATLPTVAVKDSREGEGPGYQATTTTIGKVAQMPRDIPQSLSIITEQLMQDRNATTVVEALRNVPGVTFNAGEGGRNGDNITIRGFSSVGDLYLDTIRDVAQYNRDTFNLSEIDVLRGSASMLFGRGSTGGVVNQVSKVPFLVTRGEATLTAGSYDYLRATADVNVVIGESAAMRINAMGTDSESFRDGPHYRRWGVAPSVTSGIGTRDELNLAFYYLDESNIPDFGVPYYRGLPLPVPVEGSYYGLVNADYEKYRTAIATATYVHRFDASAQLKNVLRFGDYQRDLWPTAPRLQGNPDPLLPTSVITRGRPGRQGEDRDWTNQTDFTAKFATGTVRHLVLVGMELASEDSWTQRFGQLPGINVPTTTVGNPNDSPYLPPGFDVKNVTAETRFKSSTAGLYAQDFLEIGPLWKLLAGLRWDWFDADYERIGPLADYGRTDRVWSFRTGLLFQPSDEQSYYLSWGSSFNPSGELYALDPRGANTPPEKNYNYELGAKWDLFEGNLSLQAVLYRSEKTNERNTDPLIADVFLLSGRRHTDGIELEAAGRITSSWQVFGGVAFMQARIDESINAADVGKTPINTPPYTASLWTTYQFAPSWRAGLGWEAVGKRYTSLANTTQLPAYNRWDAMVAYEKPDWAVRLNLFNVLNETYYTGLYTGHALPGVTRSAQVTVELKF